MGVSIVFVVETNKNCNSDWMYISTAVKYIYEIHQEIKLSQVYMNGKTNYNKKSVIGNIKKIVSAKKNDSCIVIYCFDVDENNKEDIQRNKSIRKYCEKSQYEMIWFNKNIEEVFINKQIKNNKHKEAERFVRKKLISKIEVNKLNDESINRYKSNMLCVLDKYLKRKKLKNK